MASYLSRGISRHFSGITALLLSLLLLIGCSDSKPTATSAPPSSSKAQQGPSADQLFRKLRSAYSEADSYADNISVVFSGLVRSTGSEQVTTYTSAALAFQRPNKVSLIYQESPAGPQQQDVYKIVSNGAFVRSLASELPDQVHEAIAPQVLTPDNFIPEPELRSAVLKNTLQNTLPQLAMLLAPTAEQPVFVGEDKPRRLSDAELDDKPYYRLELSTPAGGRVFWIDQEQYTLRRMEIPIDHQKQLIDAQNRYSEISVWIDFANVSLDAEVEQQTFELAVPDGARRVRRLIPPPPDGHAEFVEQYKQALDAAEIKDTIVEVEVALPEVPPRLLPTELRLQQLWQTSSEQLQQPGAVLVLPDAQSPYRVLVLDQGQAIVELDHTGQTLARHELPEHGERSGGFLRTWSDGAEQRWYLASGVGWQQVYLFDQQWQAVLSFPDERHSGIGDVLLDDLAGSGTPLMYVGYRGGLGVQGGTLDGRRVWANRQLDHVLQVGLGPEMADGKQTAWCTSTRGTLMHLGADGRSLEEIYLPGQSLMYFASQPDGEYHCGLAVGRVGQYTAVGFDSLHPSSRSVAWEYALPPGEYVEQLQRVQSVRLPNGEEGWLIVAANGSLHWLSAAGELVARFDYGQIMTGVASPTVGEQTLLLVATVENLTAWQVNAPPEPLAAEPESATSLESTEQDPTVPGID